jgi:hypothetical protein
MINIVLAILDYNQQINTMKYISILLLLLINQGIFCQNYTVLSFQSEYQPLTDYTSICEEGLDEGDFDVEFDFDFPYQDTVFRSINANNRGIYSFYNVDDWFTIALLNFIYDSNCNHQGEDTRYTITELDGLKVAIVENTILRLANDESIDEFDSSFTFQNRFFEDGSIEIHFGESNLENSTAYIEGEGFYLTGGPPTPLGPYIYLQDYDTSDEIFSVSGHFDELTYGISGPSVLSVIPPTGWIIRLQPITLDTEDGVNEEVTITLSPNPTSGQLRVVMPDMFSGSLIVRDMTGKTIKQSLINNQKETQVDLSQYDSGIYTVEVINTNSGLRLVERVVVY